jgi:hypothetical protein
MDTMSTSAKMIQNSVAPVGNEISGAAGRRGGASSSVTPNS